MEREIWKGSEAIAEAAIKGGCQGFFGYPITPQNEIPEYMSHRMPTVGGVFVQAESELAAINMVYGAAAAGMRVMTSSSSPGISLKQEGISYLAATELPAVIVNCNRGGPGLGTIQPSQSDYYQATRGGGNGADEYRTPVLFLVDGLIAQMMEPIHWNHIERRKVEPKDWAASGRNGRDHNNFVTSLLMDSQACEAHNLKLGERYKLIEEKECRWENIKTDDAEIVLVSYGTPARICLTAIEALREEGIKVGMMRPITLWPFPEKPLRELAEKPEVKAFMSVEMSLGQMVDDVKLAVAGLKPVSFCGRTGGMIPSVTEVKEAVKALL